MSTIHRQTTAFVQECKVCKDAGKPEALCRTHRVKDSTGKVICPTLLSQQCLKCGKKGHTVKFCAATKAVTVTVLPPKKNDLTPVNNNSNKNTKKQSNNLFDLLDSEDDEFVAVKKTEKKKGNIDDFENNYPKLCTSMKKIFKEEVKTNHLSAPLQQQQPITKSYIDVLAKPVSVSQDLQPIVKLPKTSTQDDSQENFVPFSKKKQEELQDMKLAKTEEQLKRQLHNHDCFNGRNGLSWADAYDSDDDDYDDYDDYNKKGYYSKILISNAIY